ncbi:MAG: hypothetical protein ACRCZS_13285 [Chroococcidiopsis sp.]
MADEIGFIQRLEKGIPLGVAPLNENNAIALQYLPERATSIYEAEADEDLEQGSPVYLKLNGHCAKASASMGVLAQVIGCAIASCNTGFICSYAQIGTVTNDDWREVAPHSLLKVGQIYYLDVNLGGITDIPPESGYLVVLGRAINTNAIALNIQQSILL